MSLITALGSSKLQLSICKHANEEPANTPVWKAAQASTAALANFKQFGKYIDCGMKANNPSMSTLTRIH